MSRLAIYIITVVHHLLDLFKKTNMLYSDWWKMRFAVGPVKGIPFYNPSDMLRMSQLFRYTGNLFTHHLALYLMCVPEF